MGPNVLEVAGPAVLLSKERCAFVELARGASGTFGRVGAVEVRNMAVSDVAEPILQPGLAIVNVCFGEITHQ
jgi:hypothetical protein